jgi:hypothetical protein
MRLVGSMSTLPSRISTIIEPIKHILDQTLCLDALYLNIPYKTIKGHIYKIPKNFLKNFTNYSTKVILNRCIDHGPITKLSPTLDLETDPNTIIITFDDDIIVTKNLIKTLLKKSTQYPNACLGFSGVCVGTFPFSFHLALDNEIDVKVDFVQGVHTILYKRSFFSTSKELIEYWDKTPIKNILFYNDDHHISAYLADKKIERFSIGFNIQRYLYKFAEKQADALSLNFTNLVKQHSAIIDYFKKKGIYNLSYTFLQSPYLILLLLCVSILLLSFSILYKNVYYALISSILLSIIKFQKNEHSLLWFKK